MDVHCDDCATHWIQNERNLYGYMYLSRGQHIPSVYHRAVTQGASSTAERRDENVEEQLPDRIVEEGESSNVGNPQRNEIIESWYLPLYNAAMSGDWINGEQIFREHEEALRAKTKSNGETPLHVAVGSGKKTKFFTQELLKLLSPLDLETTSNDGLTPLAIAAKVGNIEAADLLIAHHERSLYVPDSQDNFPVHIAAQYGHKDMLIYLLQVTKMQQNPDPYDPEGCGSRLLHSIIAAQFYDVAVQLLELIPKLAAGRGCYLALSILAENPSAFSCKKRGPIQSLIYKCAPNPQDNESYMGPRDVENQTNEDSNSHSCCKKFVVSGLQKMHLMIWTCFGECVPDLNRMKEMKFKRYQSMKLMKLLCREASIHLTKSSATALLFKLPLLKAVENGIHEMVREIIGTFGDTVWYTNDTHCDVFKVAIKYRQHEVYNLLFEMGDLQINNLRNSKEGLENILHLAAYLPPPDRLEEVTGAALQMQRELQWFKEIESLLQPSHKSARNEKDKTPHEVFTKSHKELMVKGEQWMRGTATSCTLVAALIATVVFAAAITVPGGISADKGQPVLGSERSFTIFAATDGASFVTACTAILMFLSILTSRYAEIDFLLELPKRLIKGLLALFFSLLTMMVAFGSTLYLMFGHHGKGNFAIALGISSVVVVLFARIEFPLLIEMYFSTFRCGLFRRNKHNISCSVPCGFLNKAD